MGISIKRVCSKRERKKVCDAGVPLQMQSSKWAALRVFLMSADLSHLPGSVRKEAIFTACANDLSCSSCTAISLPLTSMFGHPRFLPDQGQDIHRLGD
jgi:hypothetical protein